MAVGCSALEKRPERVTRRTTERQRSMIASPALGRLATPAAGRAREGQRLTASTASSTTKPWPAHPGRAPPRLDGRMAPAMMRRLHHQARTPIRTPVTTLAIAAAGGEIERPRAHTEGQPHQGTAEGQRGQAPPSTHEDPRQRSPAVVANAAGPAGPALPSAARSPGARRSPRSTPRPGPRTGGRRSPVRPRGGSRRRRCSHHGQPHRPGRRTTAAAGRRPASRSTAARRAVAGGTPMCTGAAITAMASPSSV